MSPMGGHFNANFLPILKQIIPTTPTPLATATTTTILVQNINEHFSNQFIKCKIIDPKNDIIVIKLNKGELKLINDLKIALKSRININFPPVSQPQQPL